MTEHRTSPIRGTGKKKIRKSIWIILLVIIVAAAAGIYYGTAFGAETLDEAVTVEIPDGAGAQQIGSLLEENGVVKHGWSFVSYAEKQGASDTLHSGSYTFGPGEITLESVLESLQSGVDNDVTSNITIPEGLTVEQVAETLESEGIVTKQEFLDAAAAFDTSAYSYIPEGDTYNKLEGFLFPETYNIMNNWGSEEIIGMMLNQFDTVFTEEMRQRADEMGYSVYEIVTMASLVEREALYDEDRPVIAGVFYNRLEIGMRLQSCASVQYILGEPKARLSNEDISIDNPYNTYLYEGLTPGPIASPGETSLQAALYPEDTDYMYFVAMPDGHHHFSTTYEEHLAATEEYLE